MFIVFSLLCTFPLLSQRYAVENSANVVELVVDYRSISRMLEQDGLDLNRNELLMYLKEKNVNTIALYETNLKEMQDNKIVSLYDTSSLPFILNDAYMLPLDHTLVVFSPALNHEEIDLYTEMISRVFNDIQPYEFQGSKALIIKEEIHQVENRLLGIDLVLAKILHHEFDFNLAARLKSNRKFDPNFLEWQFAQLSKLGINKMIFDGGQVLGYPDTEQMKQVSEWMNTYGFNLSLIEFHDQLGSKSLSRLNKLQSIRLFSMSSQVLAGYHPQRIIDMASLAVTERNIRILYMHLPYVSALPGNESIKKFDEALTGIVTKLNDKGYELGDAIPFSSDYSQQNNWYYLGIALGVFSLISLLVSKFWFPLIYIPLPLGIALYTIGFITKHDVLILQLFALLGAVAAPTMAIIKAVEWSQQKKQSRPFLALNSILIFISACFISLYGALAVAGLLSDIVFIKYIEQFRGVKLLFIMPIVLTSVYLVLAQYSISEVIKRVHRFLNQALLVKHLLILAVVFIIGWYYLSRSGNYAFILPFELEFRQLLADLFGVRPRTKEVFFGHPLLILAIYCFMKYGRASLVFVFGAIGQMSIVNTFTHLHTPLLVSLERTIIGLILGLLIGLLLIWLFNLSIKKWIEKRGYKNWAISKK
ncbi:DUF5693 family protein [Caldalkalibacillus thermarum]|nr:DUF5693 family protein [Caldalkalibacillus thermarum]